MERTVRRPASRLFDWRGALIRHCLRQSLHPGEQHRCPDASASSRERRVRGSRPKALPGSVRDRGLSRRYGDNDASAAPVDFSGAPSARRELSGARSLFPPRPRVLYHLAAVRKRHLHLDDAADRNGDPFGDRPLLSDTGPSLGERAAHEHHGEAAPERARGGDSAADNVELQARFVRSPHSDRQRDGPVFLRRAPVAIARITDSLHRDGCGSRDRKSTRLNSSHGYISYAVFCLKKKIKNKKKQILTKC